MGKGVAFATPFVSRVIGITLIRRFSELFFRKISATGRVVAAAGDFHLFQATITALNVVAATFHVAFNRFVFNHSTLLFGLTVYGFNGIIA